MNKTDIDFANSVYDETSVFEYKDSLYEDLRPFLHFDFNSDLVKDNIKFREIFSEDDYDYIQNNDILTRELEDFLDYKN